MPNPLKQDRNNILEIPTHPRLRTQFERVRVLAEILVIEQEVKAMRKQLAESLGEGGYIEVGPHSAEVSHGRLIVR